MEEKKFPWLLRLLSSNEISIQVLDTYVISKERVLAAFTLSQDSLLNRKSVKSSGLETVYSLLNSLKNNLNSNYKQKIRHCFFLHKSKRTKINEKRLINYSLKKINLPCVTYIQTSSEDFSMFTKFLVEYKRDSFKSTFIPPNSISSLIEKAKELTKCLIALIEAHEQRKVLNLQLEFMVDSSQKIWLSYLDFCQTVKEEDLNSKMFRSIDCKTRSSETLEIFKEFDSFKLRGPSQNSSRDTSQRKPSFIRKLEGLESYKEHVRIDSPQSERELEEQCSDEVGQKGLKKEGYKVSEDFIELLSKTKIQNKYLNKQKFISEEEFAEEFEAISKELKYKQLLESSRKKTQELAAFKKTPSIRYQNPQLTESKKNAEILSNHRIQISNKIFSPVLINRKKFSLSPSCRSVDCSKGFEANIINVNLGQTSSTLNV